MARIKYVSDQGPDGCSFGTVTTDLISFYGVTPIVQPASASQALVTVSTITTASTSTSPYGFADTTQFTNALATVVNCRTLVNQLRTDLIALGLIKGAA